MSASKLNSVRRVSVLFHRVGPYHFARLRETGNLMDTTVIEMAGVDNTYAWEPVEEEACFKRLTLFKEVDSRSQSSREIISRLQAALQESHPDVVVVNGWAEVEALGAIQWCQKQKIPCVVMSESTEWDEQRKPLKEWVKRRVIGLCSTALAGGTPQADYLAKLGMPREHIFLGYDAVDNAYFTGTTEEVRKRTALVNGQWSVVTGQQSESSAFRSQLSAFPHKFFLASARFVEKKNLPRLIQAYACYRELSTLNSQPSTSPWHLVILGDGPLRPALNNQLSTLNLHDFVHLPGFKQYDELPYYYAHASVFVHASTTEQWGLVVNEAMASGLPVLVSNRCGCAQDLIQEGINGFTFDPYDVEQLAKLMLRMTLADGSSNPQVSGFNSHPSDAVSAFNFPLSGFGAASRRIISNWGPERFAQGMHRAIEKALEAECPRASLLEKLLLKALLFK